MSADTSPTLRSALLLDGPHGVEEGEREAVEARHHQHVARLQCIKRAARLAPLMVSRYTRAPCPGRFLKLCVEGLAGG